MRQDNIPMYISQQRYYVEVLRTANGTNVKTLDSNFNKSRNDIRRFMADNVFPNSSKDASVLCQAPCKVSNLSAAQPIHKFNFNFTLPGK